jgi:hypothetical protein
MELPISARGTIGVPRSIGKWWAAFLNFLDGILRTKSPVSTASASAGSGALRTTNPWTSDLPIGEVSTKNDRKPHNQVISVRGIKSFPEVTTGPRHERSGASRHSPNQSINPLSTDEP